VAFIDLNGFKGVNDTFGHASGDQVLVEMANRFRKTLRGKDLIIRWGGDEFLIILPGAAKPQAVQAFLNRVKAIAEIPIQLNGRDVSLSASFGSARWGGETTFHTAIDIADDAMYNAKRKSIGTEHGIECVAVHKHFSHSSLESGRIRVVMQPVFDIDCSRIQSYEALMRFHDSNGHLHSACDVLTAAAQTGMLDKMEVSVWHQACQAAGELKTLTLSAPTIAINVFPTTVMRRGFLSELRTICKCHGIVHEQVIAEIAEDRLIAGWSTCFPFLEELVEHGFGVGLDDCVMELPLTRLTSLPFRHIKVRADILRRASLRDASAYRLLRALESIRSTFPLDVIVSRVESDDDIRLAKLFNFTQVQGFYFRSTDFSPSCGDASTPSRSSSTAFPAPRPLDLAPL
jgi:diguanylate cyclase (GGDEF)-like protein